MRITCIKIDSYGLNLRDISTILTNDFDFSDGGYGLEINREYVVMGMVIYKNSPCIYYLIDVNGTPDWFPSVLFKISDNTLPFNWCFGFYAEIVDVNIYAIWGFQELCTDDSFYDKLMDRDKDAIQVYFKRKLELE